MSRTQRFGLLGVAAITLVMAFLALRPKDAATPTRSTAAPPATTSSATGAVTPTAPPVTEPSPGPLLEAGAVERLRVAKGEQVRFRVRSQSAEELHVHGYDIERDLAAGKTVPVSFEATIDGVFEIEFERAGEQIASLRVDP